MARTATMKEKAKRSKQFHSHKHVTRGTKDKKFKYSFTSTRRHSYNKYNPQEDMSLSDRLMQQITGSVAMMMLRGVGRKASGESRSHS